MITSTLLLPSNNGPSDSDALIPNNFIIKNFNNFATGDFNEDHISTRKKLNQYSLIQMNFGEDL